MTEPPRAVFLSYASEDAAAAQCIAEALRAAGIEVWFDKSELRGGDAWDRQIRKQIHDCALFIPIISANTAARHEGYFRLEWDLADQRTHMIARNRAFIVPVCVDATPEISADAPESFQRVQWTRLHGGGASPAFVERVQKLLVPDAPTRAGAAAPTSSALSVAPASKPSRHSTWPSNTVLWVISTLLAVGLAYLIAGRLWHPQHSQAPAASQKAASSTGANPSTAAAFSPPPHSIAVLPFVNVSGDKDQEYFSDGLTEEILNSLARINELQVAGRTSSFYFKGEHADLATIAHKLNVAAVLEGSVRRSAQTVRVTTELINAVTGFHLWSETYDRNLGDVLELQTDIANSVTGALRVTLLGDMSTKIELGGTRNPEAFDAYLRGLKMFGSFHDGNDVLAAIAAYTEAIQRDRTYALPFAGRSQAYTRYAEEYATGTAVRDGFARARADAYKAVELAAGLVDAHLALAHVFESGSLDFTRANKEYQRAAELGPGNAQVLRESGLFAVRMGQTDTGIAAARRAGVLDPLNRSSHSYLGLALLYARRYDEAIAVEQAALMLDPNRVQNFAVRGQAYYALGNLQSARRSCEIRPDNWQSQQCLALVYDKLGRHADAEAVLAKIKASMGDAPAFQYAELYAQWGNIPKALEWLDTAVRLRDPGLVDLKMSFLLDPLRKEPRFQAIERALKFPEK